MHLTDVQRARFRAIDFLNLCVTGMNLGWCVFMSYYGIINGIFVFGVVQGSFKIEQS